MYSVLNRTFPDGATASAMHEHSPLRLPRPSATNSRRRAVIAVIVCVTAGTASAPHSRAPVQVPPGHRTANPDSIHTAIRRRLDGVAPGNAYSRANWKRVNELYAAQQHRALWSDTAAGAHPLGPKAALLLDALASASSQGLATSGYLAGELASATSDVQRDPSSTDARAHADVMLTAAFVAYATDLLRGQIEPRSVNREWHIDPRDVDVDSALVHSLRHASFSEALVLLRPQDADYAALMEALARYRQLVEAGGWPRVPSTAVLRPGDTTTAATLGLLMARLHAEQHTTLTPLVPVSRLDTNNATIGRGPARPVIYDAPLAGVVAEYQRRHALVVDSIVGPSTLASLNQPAEFRLGQIAANLERHRWLPRDRGERYVLVNVPAFRLRAYSDGREVLTMPVVVGAEYEGRTTPVFSDSMSYVVFRPYWNVPQGIATRELWPQQRRDPSYFSRHGYETVRASWGMYVRQKPSSNNALGRAKFIFPNDHAVYLHDSPAQALFAEAARAFSHGCIRVEHPDQLAEFVLKPEGWDIDRVRTAMSSGAENHRVNLARKLPVYIVYFTTFARDGVLHFGNDVYDRDDPLVRAMRRLGPTLEAR